MTDQTVPDDYGISPTNDPRIHTRWELHGRTLHLALVTAEEPEAGWQLTLPCATEET